MKNNEVLKKQRKISNSGRTGLLEKPHLKKVSESNLPVGYLANKSTHK